VGVKGTSSDLLGLWPKSQRRFAVQGFNAEMAMASPPKREYSLFVPCGKLCG
jgi:hypothetical protein